MLWSYGVIVHQKGVTPTDSIVTAATAGQSFDQLFLAIDRADFRPWTLSHAYVDYAILHCDRPLTIFSGTS